MWFLFFGERITPCGSRHICEIASLPQHLDDVVVDSFLTLWPCGDDIEVVARACLCRTMDAVFTLYADEQASIIRHVDSGVGST